MDVNSQGWLRCCGRASSESHAQEHAQTVSGGLGVWEVWQGWGESHMPTVNVGSGAQEVQPRGALYADSFGVDAWEMWPVGAPHINSRVTWDAWDLFPSGR